MTLDRLHQILNETTVQLRKGEVVTKETQPGLEVTTIDMMPHVDEAGPEFEKVDVHFMWIGVDKAKAEERRAEVYTFLRDNDQLFRQGPSYIAIGGLIGDQGAAFQLLALGKVLGFWDVITPASLGADAAQAEQLAGAGYIMASGCKL